MTVTPAMQAQLPAIVAGLQPMSTLVFMPGTYNVPGTAALTISTSDVVVRSASGDPADVTLVGDFTRPLVSVNASRVVITGLTLQSGASAIRMGILRDVNDVLLYKLRIAANSFVGINAAGVNAYADGVTLACSSVELGDAGRLTLQNNGQSCQVRGLDVAGGRTWNILDNTFDGFWCSGGEAVAVLIHGGSRDIVFARNQIRNSFVGLRVGLASDAAIRTYSDGPACASGQPMISATEARVVNNLVVEDGSVQPSFDSAIALWNTCDADINHNTLSIANGNVFSAIEYRFAISTGVRVLNNAITDVASSGTGVAIRARDGATADTRGNVIAPDTSLYTMSGSQPVTPAATSPVLDAADCTGNPPGCDTDFYEVQRGRPADVGAIEVP